MNHRVSVSAALALGTLLTCFVPPARAQTLPTPAPVSPGVQAQIDRMRTQIEGLQAEVKRLQSGQTQIQPGLSTVAPIRPGSNLFFYGWAPSLKSLTIPDLKSLPGQSLGGQVYTTPAQPRRYTNIPDFKVIPLSQPSPSVSPQ